MDLKISQKNVTKNWHQFLCILTWEFNQCCCKIHTYIIVALVFLCSYIFRSEYNFNKAKHLKSAIVIKLVSDALSVTSCKRNTIKLMTTRIAFSNILEKIHCTAIETLLALIKWYHFDCFLILKY